MTDCDQSGRVLPGYDWTDHNRMRCPGCGKRVTVVAGRVPSHRPPRDAPMSQRPRVLDLFCGGGGGAMGYYRSGFDVTGVDVVDQPNYPFTFRRRDALELLRDGIDPVWDVIHASPPCQAYSTLGHQQSKTYASLYAEVRELLEQTGRPWVIENVPGAPFRSGVVLCGSMFGLKVRRHRNFESSHLMLSNLVCDHEGQGQPLGVYGTGGGGQMTRGRKATRAEGPAAMGIDWPMTPYELSQAIPPAYCEFIGEQLMEAI